MELINAEAISVYFHHWDFHPSSEGGEPKPTCLKVASSSSYKFNILRHRLDLAQMKWLRGGRGVKIDRKQLKFEWKDKRFWVGDVERATDHVRKCRHTFLVAPLRSFAWSFRCFHYLEWVHTRTTPVLDETFVTSKEANKGTPLESEMSFGARNEKSCIFHRGRWKRSKSEWIGEKERWKKEIID